MSESGSNLTHVNEYLIHISNSKTMRTVDKPNCTKYVTIDYIMDLEPWQATIDVLCDMINFGGAHVMMFNSVERFIRRNL